MRALREALQPFPELRRICGAIRARELLCLRTEIVGVQCTGAPAYAHIVKHGKTPVLTPIRPAP